MGTRACTRIQTHNDYIEMATRWDGFPDEIKEHLSNLISEWETTHSILLRKNSAILGNAYDNWIHDLGLFIADAKAHPTIEKLTVLFCARRFVHHHVMPSSTNPKDHLLKYWGAGFPDVVASIHNGQQMTDTPFEFDTNAIHPEVEHKEIETGYSIVRIIDREDTEHYVDIKVKNYEPQEFLNKVWSLNQLWRNIHYSTQEKRPTDDSTSILWTYNLQFEQFYRHVGAIDPDGEAYKKILERALSRVDSMIPFDMFVNALATHFCIANPGKILPLTQAQKNHQQQPVAIVKIINSRLSDFAIDFIGLNQQQKIDLMDSAYSYLVEEEYDFEEHNGVRADHGHIGITEDEQLYFAYESNLCKYLTSTVGVLPPVKE